MTSAPWKVRAKTASRPTNPDPIKMQAGDLLEIAGEEDEGKTRRALADYDATELPVEEGEVFQAELEECGWLWCENTQGKRGWVRRAQVEDLDEA
jgi:hypothetical protein